MPILRLFVSLVCVAGAAMAFGAPSAFAASSGTSYDLTSVNTPFPQPTGRFGERHAATDDIDGDGVNDYFIGDLSEDVGLLTNAGRVYAISGKTRAVIYTFLSPEPQANASFGFFISVLGDVDGDGKNDIAVGTDSQDTTAAGEPCTALPSPAPPTQGTCNRDQGKAWVFSGGKGGRLLYAVNNPNPQGDGRFGSRIGRAGDVTGDGVPESIMGASNNDSPTAGCGNATPVPAGCRKNQGQAYIFNGKTGAGIRELNAPADDQAPGASCSSQCGTFGLSVQGPGDVDGDGVTDQLVDAGSRSLTPEGKPCTPPASGSPPNGCNGTQGRMYLFSGKTGGLLSRIDDPAPQANVNFGFQDAAPLSPGDVNGDGRAEIFANGFTQNGADGLEAEGRVWVFDGKATVDNPALRGKVLYEPKDPTPTEAGQFAFSLARTDYNKDGTPDLYLGQTPHQVQRPGVDQTGGTYIFDGRNGSLLKSLVLPAGTGTPAENEKNKFVAQRGSGTFGNLGSNLGWSVAAPGDLNGDGEPDYLAAATWQDNGANQDEGRAFVFLSKAPGSVPPGSVPPGSVPPGSVPKGCNSAGVKILGKTNSGGRVLQGSNGNDRICGTSRGDLITGNGGNDVITGAAGNDRINGGSGKDRINGGSGKDRISGSSGNDVISGSSGNDRINGNSGSDRINGNSGNDRITGASGNDVISGSTGKDIISGSSGNDRLSGNSGNDRINGNSGADRISGGSGNDRLIGSSGNDRISGGSGRDRISGGPGKDRIKQ